jgi:hypothetical protein
LRTLVPLVLGLACTSEPVDEPVTCETVDRTNCVEIAPGDVEALQNTVNALEDDSAIVLGEGTYTFDNALTIRNADQVTLIGQGIDETTLDLEIVAEAQIDGVVEPIAVVIEDIDVGDTNPFYVLPSVGGVPVCQANAIKTVESATPDICTIRERAAPEGTSDADFEYGWFDVTGESQGTCEYVVTYPNGNDGAGVSETFTFEIEP